MNEDFSDFDIMKTELYHHGYSQDFMDKCEELGIENIETYICPHMYGCDCGTRSGCEELVYFCLYCGDKKMEHELKTCLNCKITFGDTENQSTDFAFCGESCWKEYEGN